LRNTAKDFETREELKQKVKDKMKQIHQRKLIAKAEDQKRKEETLFQKLLTAFGFVFYVLIFNSMTGRLYRIEDVRKID
jgi:hypothetical protein